MKEMSQHFFMRAGFEKFHLDPEANRQLLIGERDRKNRDVVLDALEEGVYSGEGHKGVIFGDFGRGKTHEAQNIIWEVEHRDLHVVPVYVKCHEFKTKEPFSSLFSMLLSNLGWKRIQTAAFKYGHLENAGKVPPIAQVVGSDDIGLAFAALSNPNPEYVRGALSWLGGDSGVKTNSIAPGLPKSLSLSRDFASVMKGLSHLFRKVDEKILVFFIDEAERIALITHTDTYWSWIGCLRALTELQDVGFIFYAGSKSRDDIPNMLLWDEVVTRIGSQNYLELTNPSYEELKQWVLELFQTLIRKGAPPKAHEKVLPSEALDATIPGDLATIAPTDDERRAYPFTPTAIDEFVKQCITQDLGNRPREVLKRIQSAAKRAMRHEKPVIDEAILHEVQGDL